MRRVFLQQCNDGSASCMFPATIGVLWKCTATREELSGMRDLGTTVGVVSKFRVSSHRLREI